MTQIKNVAQDESHQPNLQVGGRCPSWKVVSNSMLFGLGCRSAVWRKVLVLVSVMRRGVRVQFNFDGSVLRNCLVEEHVCCCQVHLTGQEEAASYNGRRVVQAYFGDFGGT